MSDNGNKRYYWLKLSEDFFRQKEIKQLRRMAGGDTFTIIYLKMLLRSLEDGGRLYYEGIEQDFVSELALDLDEELENVKLTVAYLTAKGILIHGGSDEYELLTAGEMTGSETASTRRSRKSRANRMAGNGQKLLQCNTDATKRNTEIEIDTDKDTDIDTDREKNPSDSCAEQSEDAPAPAKPIVFSLPLNDGTEHSITRAEYDRYCSLYPAVDVMRELRKMAGWLDGNPRNRKTRSGIKRFINGWLSREQDRGRVQTQRVGIDRMNNRIPESYGGSKVL